MQLLFDIFRLVGMKWSFLYFIAVLSIGTNSFEQCCPYVDPIEIIPVSPTETDSIYVVTNVTTPNSGTYLGYTIFDYGSTVRIEACYYNGMLTVLTPFTDTINIGVKPAGDYEIEFVAYLSGDMSLCTYSDSNQVSDSVTVISLIGGTELETESSLFLYPNPATDGMIFLNTGSDNSLPYILYNSLGEVVLTGETTSNKPISVAHLHGVYFMTVSTNSEIITQKILIP